MTVKRSLKRVKGALPSAAEELLGSPETEVYGPAILLLLLASFSPSWLSCQAAAKFPFHFDK